MKTRILFLFISLFCTVSGWSARVDTVKVASASMKKELPVLVITPENVSQPLPVIYLLHGYSGNFKSWFEIKPQLKEIADRDGIIFVCPDGKNSWYWDSPLEASSQYETYITKEMIPFIDSKYPTIKEKKGRAITGLSMGGHGAMWLGLRHKDLFGAVGSTSGGLDIRPFPANWEMKTQLGPESENRQRWTDHAAISQIDRVQNGDLAIIIDCGNDDFFLPVNKEFHEKLLKYQIDHDFIVRPGAHNAQYWRNSIDYQILFFKNFFNRK